MPLDDNDDFTLTMKVREVNQLLMLLQDAPYRMANPLINTIMQQGQRQQMLAQQPVSAPNGGQHKEQVVDDGVVPAV